MAISIFYGSDKLADDILFVLGASETPRNLVVKAKDLLEPVPIVGAVLNRASPVAASYISYATKPRLPLLLVVR